MQLYTDHGYTAKQKRPGEHCGPCPFCREGTDRFLIFTGQGKDGAGRYLCRVCGQKGDSIQFLRDLDGMSYKEATDALGLDLSARIHRAGPAAPPAPPPVFAPTPAIMPSAAWQEKAGAIVDYAAGQLDKNREAQAWLFERGISPFTIEDYKLGWLPKTLWRPYQAFGMAPEIKPNGKPKKVAIPQGLCIPVYHNGQLARVKFRPADPAIDFPKYMPLTQPAGAKNTSPLFIPCENPNAPFFICESELDALLVGQFAGHLVNIIATGSASFKPDKETWAQLLNAPLVFVSLDYDDAGNKAACTFWRDNLPDRIYRLFPTPEGKDQTDAYKAGYNLAEWIKAGIDKG